MICIRDTTFCSSPGCTRLRGADHRRVQCLHEAAEGPLIERVVAGQRPSVADDWIAEPARAGVIVVTNDVPLAHRSVTAGAEVIEPTGKRFDTASIGMALATRDLMADLRSAGTITGGPQPFSKLDRSAFLQALDRAIVRLRRAGHPAG